MHNDRHFRTCGSIKRSLWVGLLLKAAALFCSLKPTERLTTASMMLGSVAERPKL
jgi:hypothetical protein